MIFLNKKYPFPMKRIVDRVDFYLQLNLSQIYNNTHDKKNND